MARFEIRRKEDGRGPYRWMHVIRTQEGLALGNIYCKQGDDLTTDEALDLRRHAARAGFEVRRVPSADPSPKPST